MRVEDGYAWVASEVASVQREDGRDMVNDHSGDKAGIVDLCA
jgi:hypothetical protein